ncbi:hypothetical protein MUCCIDRAFT_161855 [Mucor lusitanicus CBS 277.49]|uniref:Uncharacterized protein n=1 Tax=Mucor lusitanicus CBS 277.49 TaxID=747725 RepID=A0A168MN25_MUCCL|nr:hypothetical protein MUCCIDRAFT_161855 [Mucor lusitanicus CBS 277.49]
MLLAPYIAAFIMAAIFSLFMAPRFEDDYPSIKYITGHYPSLVRNLISTTPLKHYQQTNSKTVIASNAPTKSDTIFGNQQTAWKPVETSESDTYDDFYYSDEYDEDAIHGWHDSNSGFRQPETILKSGNEQGDEMLLETEKKDSQNLRSICEVLMHSGIDYHACHSLDRPVVVDQITSSSPWTEADEMGIRWKKVKNAPFSGEDKGCTYFIKADSVPLKMSATPKEDGTTKLSYFTKNTIGKYCSENDDPVEVEAFYKSLIDEIRPSKLTVFLNTKVFGDFTVYDLFEYQMLLDACLIAIFQNISEGGALSRKAIIGFVIIFNQWT